MNEIIAVPLSTATPESAMKPTPAEMDSGMSRSQKRGQHRRSAPAEPPALASMPGIVPR